MKYMEEEKLVKLTEEELEAGIRIYGERIAEIEKALELNVEYLSEKEKCELKIAALKEKKGIFFSIYRKYLEYKLIKSVNASPQKLNRRSRKILEEKLEKYKKRVADFYKTKSFRNYEIK
jgi:hypothetical protein